MFEDAKAALVTLAILQTVMLGALYAQIPPHPPATVAPFAIGPYLGAALSAIAAALILWGRPGGRAMAVLAALLALVSFGPQKYLDPQIALIWPAVVVGQIAALVIFAAAIRGGGRAWAPPRPMTGGPGPGRPAG